MFADPSKIYSVKIQSLVQCGPKTKIQDWKSKGIAQYSCGCGRIQSWTSKSRAGLGSVQGSKSKIRKSSWAEQSVFLTSKIQDFKLCSLVVKPALKIQDPRAISTPQHGSRPTSGDLQNYLQKTKVRIQIPVAQGPKSKSLNPTCGWGLKIRKYVKASKGLQKWGKSKHFWVKSENH